MKRIANMSILEAIATNDLDAVREYIQSGAPMDIRDESGCTPLMCAIKIENVEVVDLLLQAGANPCISDSYCRTALHYAMKYKNVSILQRILTHSSIQFFKDRLLHMAASIEDNTEIIECLLQNGICINGISPESFTPQHLSSYTPLHLAARIGCSSANVKVLLQYGANVHVKTSQNKTPLDYAVCSKNIESVRELLLYGADVNNSSGNGNTTPLHEAVDNKDINMVTLLLANGAQVNARDIAGQTPLHYAIQLKCMPIVNILLSNYADYTLSDYAGVNVFLDLPVEERQSLLENTYFPDVKEPEEVI